MAHAQATSASKLTDRGRVMVDGGLGARWFHARQESNLRQPAPWQAHVQPGVTYFVADRVGIGLSVGGSFSQRDDRFGLRLGDSWTARVRTYELWAGPHAVLELPLLDKVSLLAVPGVYYMRHWRRLTQRVSHGSPHDPVAPGGPQASLDFLEYDAHFVRLALTLPLVFHVSSSIALGFGPALWWDRFLAQDPRGTRSFTLSPWAGPAGFQSEVDPYPRSRLALGIYSWLGGSF